MVKYVDPAIRLALSYYVTLENLFSFSEPEQKYPNSFPWSTRSYLTWSLLPSPNPPACSFLLVYDSRLFIYFVHCWIPQSLEQCLTHSGNSICISSLNECMTVPASRAFFFSSKPTVLLPAPGKCHCCSSCFWHSSPSSAWPHPPHPSGFDSVSASQRDLPRPLWQKQLLPHSAPAHYCGFHSTYQHPNYLLVY